MNKKIFIFILLSFFSFKALSNNKYECDKYYKIYNIERNVLQLAVITNDTNLVEEVIKLCDKLINFSHRKSDFLTPLLEANSPQMAELLIKNGANKKETSILGMNYLMHFLYVYKNKIKDLEEINVFMGILKEAKLLNDNNKEKIKKSLLEKQNRKDIEDFIIKEIKNDKDLILEKDKRGNNLFFYAVFDANYYVANEILKINKDVINIKNNANETFLEPFIYNKCITDKEKEVFFNNLNIDKKLLNQMLIDAINKVKNKKELLSNNGMVKHVEFCLYKN